jgi:hypothetical protein
VFLVTAKGRVKGFPEWYFWEPQNPKFAGLADDWRQLSLLMVKRDKKIMVKPIMVKQEAADRSQFLNTDLVISI